MTSTVVQRTGLVAAVVVPVALFASVPTQVATAQAIQSKSESEIKRVVRTCVDVVRATPSESIQFRQFDAYYDAVTNKIKWLASPQMVYYFNKCLSEHGFAPE